MRKFFLSTVLLLIAGSFHAYTQTDFKKSMKGSVNLQESNLPIVVINSGEEIKEDERVYATMGIIWNKGEEINRLSDDYNDYDGRIRIELHGKSSLMFPKNSYRFETQDKYRENLNVSILDMPADDDWILYAPYSDKSLMRNALAYTLAGEINDYAPRIRFCQLIIGGEYKGVYVMTEKIKEHGDRVDIAELTSQDVTVPAITGGYVFRKDKVDAGDNLIQLSQSNVTLIINEPKKEDITNTQQSWLVNHLNEFEQVLYSGGTYADYIDVESFVHNFLIVEFAKNIDGYRLSTYFHKDRGEKIVAGPVWDYNLSFGNADYYEGWTPKGWYYPLPAEEQQIDDIYWFRQLIEDSVFYNTSIQRWQELRKDQFSLHHIFSLIDQWTGKLEEAQSRNFSKYPILGQYVWPNPVYPPTWGEEIERLKHFIKERLKWIDEQFGLKSMKVRLNVADPPKGQIIHNRHVIHDSTSAEIFTEDSIIQLHAVPGQGYQFSHWEKGKTGNDAERIIEKGSYWKYWDKGTKPGTEWMNTGYDDSAWDGGSAQLGYGDGDEETLVNFGNDESNKYVTTYFRHGFNISDTGKYEALSLELLIDDGAVTYLNGNEIIRANMPQGAVDYDTFASDFVSGEGESTFHQFNVDRTSLRPGENILAVEVHQANSTSSDISFDLGLSGILNSTNDSNRTIGQERSLNYKLTDDVSLITAHFEESLQDTVSPVINEFLAFNNSNIKDDFFENDDWIELYNPLSQPVDIGGLFISDNLSVPRKYQFPSNVPGKTTIDPNDFLVIWADGDSIQGPLHLNFRLDKNSEAIALAKEENNRLRYLDVLSFNRQESDISKGRFPDGALTWKYFNVPTPGESNVIIPTDIAGSNISENRGYRLDGNYPNPFSNQTTIGYQLPQSAHVEIAVYDHMGMLVKILVDETQTPGFYTIRWHAEDLSPGIYFYRMTCGNYSKVRKALIVR